jgi:hypothetical protein
MQSLWSGADVERMVERYAAEGVGRDLALHVYTSRLLDASLSWSCTAAAIPRSRRSCRTVEVHAVDPLDRQPDMIGEKLGHRLCYHHYGSGRTVLPVRGSLDR